MKSPFYFAFALFVLHIFPIAVRADDAVKICPGDVKALQSHEGIYAETALMEKVKRTRIWNTDPYRITEVTINRKGEVGMSYAWHEGAVLELDQCLLFQGDTLTISGPASGSSPNAPAPAPAHFVRVAKELSEADEDLPFFDLLFKGCYRDQTRRRWCFTTHSISIDGVARRAQLQLDTSEQPQGVSVLNVRSEVLYWIFKPKGNGWLVLQSDWDTTENYEPPNWSKPWMRLRPEK